MSLACGSELHHRSGEEIGVKEVLFQNQGKLTQNKLFMRGSTGVMLVTTDRETIRIRLVTVPMGQKIMMSYFRKVVGAIFKNKIEEMVAQIKEEIRGFSMLKRKQQGKPICGL